MIRHRYFYRSCSPCPWHNLAVEEYVLDRLPADTIVLYLYQNDNTVVIGKNQNAWKECRHQTLEDEGGKLARRISGGGTVFHDMGNLNFSFLVSREDYDLHRQLSVIVSAVQSLGISAEFSGRNDILSEGAKFSGNAFCFRKDSAFHHGTILIGADMGKLSRYLTVSKDKIASKGVESVRSRVCNLKERNPEIDVERVADALKICFEREYGKCEPLVVADPAAIAALEARNATWEWRLGQSPCFDIETGTRFSWGSAEFAFSLKSGVITDARVYSDAMDADFISLLPEALKGCAFRSESLAARLRALPAVGEQKKIADDIAAFFIEKGY
jgi:lipoate-protein ligase A